MKRDCYNFLLFAIFIVLTIRSAKAQGTPDVAWAKKLGNSGSTPTGLVTYDTDGNTYVGAYLDYTSLTIGGVTVTHTSGFSKYIIIKYDASGNGVWIKEIPFVFTISGNTNPHKFLYHNDKLYLFVSYEQNNIVMDGFQFPPREGGIGVGDLVLIQMDALDGTSDWIHTIARPDGFQSIPLDGFEIYIDQDDNIHAMGTFSPTLIFDTGYTLSNTDNPVGKDAFHAMYDSFGNLIYAHRLGVVNTNVNLYSHEYFYMDDEKNIYRFVKDTKTFIKYSEQGDTLFTKTFSSGAAITGMTVDPWQNVILSGYFSSSTVSFDGLITSKTGGTTDAVLIKFNSNDGTVEWLKNLGDSDCDRFDFINSDAIGNIYVLNNQYGSCFSPNSSLLVKYNNTGEKIWEKMIGVVTDPELNTSTQAMVRASNISLSPDGGTIILTGSYRGGIKLDNSVSYSGNGEYMVGFIAQYGICNTPQPTLTVSNTQFCQGDSAMLSVTTTLGYDYLWSNGDTTNTTIYVNSSGNYSVVAIQDEECYTVSEEIPITVHALPDTSVLQENISLTAVSGYTYQWIDCDNGNTPVEGAVTAVFSPEENGAYAVIVTTNEGCTDTSSCYSITTLDLMDSEEVKNISIYPNPTSGLVTIGNVTGEVHVCVTDMQGKRIIESDGTTVDLSILSPGMYTIEVYAKEGIWVEKMIRQ